MFGCLELVESYCALKDMSLCLEKVFSSLKVMIVLLCVFVIDLVLRKNSYTTVKEWTKCDI